MKRLTISFLSLYIALGATSCASRPPEMEMIEAKDLLVEYRLGGEFGLIYHHVPSLQVAIDGMAIKRFPSEGTMTTVQLDATALDVLNRKISDAQFATLQPVYTSGSSYDQPVYDITVQIDQRRYDVSIDSDPDVMYPDGLRTLLTTLQDLAQP